MVQTIVGAMLEFQFTHPVWGATATLVVLLNFLGTFQFTHPVWGATSRASIS